MNQIDKGFEVIQDVIKMRWVPEILFSIKEGNNKYSDILKNVEFLSHTELQRKLKTLQENNCIIKEETQDGAIYKLTELGYDLDHVFYHIVDLADKYFKQ